MVLSKKQQTLLWLDKAPKALFQCIHCQKLLFLETDGSLRCENNHTFNLAKQGYYFLSKTHDDDSYHAKLFQARRHIIKDSPFYQLLRDHLKAVIQDSKVILDAGSGEGSHLAMLLNEDQIGLAFDLSKSGVQLATDFNDCQFNAVADLTKLPLTDQSVDVILSILSPSNYDEFNRVGRRLIKVIPNANYLQEIRQVMYQKGWIGTPNYSHEDVLTVFKKHYPKYSSYIIKDHVPLDEAQIKDVVAMTPLTWSLDEQQRDTLLQELIKDGQMTLDVTVLQSK